MNLEIRHGLAVCKTRAPTNWELREMKPFDITADDVWNPSKYDRPDGHTPIHQLTTTDECHNVHPEDEMLNVLHVKVFPGRSNTTRTACLSQARITERDLDGLSTKFIYRPKHIIEDTIKHTTALAKGEHRTPFRRHIRSRFPQLNVKRINETVASDTLFGAKAAIGGITCAQLFVGITSAAVAVFPLRSESDGPEALQDYIRMVGAPVAMRTDNSKMQLGTAWKRILRRMIIRNENTEPHHPWQNFAERTIGTLKRQVNVLLDRTGAPENTWMLALEHVTYVWNRSSASRNNGRTPIEVQTGETPDISALLLYDFYEAIYYYDPQRSFPDSKEGLGRFVGVAEHVGDALCFRVLLDDGKTILNRSVVRSARDPDRLNRRVPVEQHITSERTPGTSVWRDDGDGTDVALLWPDEGEDSSMTGSHSSPSIHDRNIGLPLPTDTITTPERSSTTGEVRNDGTVIHPLPALTTIAGEAPIVEHPDPNMLVGKLFAIDHDGAVQTGTVTSVTRLDDITDIDIRMKADGSTVRMMYDQFLDALAPDVHPFHGIYGHRPVNRAQGRWELLVLWGTGVTTWEPLSTIFESDKVTVAKYARDNGLSDFKGWRRTKAIRGNPDKMAMLVRVFKAATVNWNGPKFKFGVRVPRNAKEARFLDKQNGDTLWADAIHKELTQIDQYKTFRTLEESEYLGPEYTQIPYHIIYDVNFDLRRKASLVAGGNHTAPPKEDVYSGVVGMETIRMGFMLAAINTQFRNKNFRRALLSFVRFLALEIVFNRR